MDPTPFSIIAYFAILKNLGFVSFAMRGLDLCTTSLVIELIFRLSE